jgi:hypothetical protein
VFELARIMGTSGEMIERAYGTPKIDPRRGRSSAGRASASQAEGRGFETRRPLQEKPLLRPEAFDTSPSPLIRSGPLRVNG